MIKIHVCIPGEPQGKERPRAAVINGKPTIYTPSKTKNYEKKIQKCYVSQTKHEEIEKGTPLNVSIWAMFGIPKSVSKKRRERMLNGEEFPCKKPDGDNIAKVVFDALNGVAWHDDVQIVDHSVGKRWAEKGAVHVWILGMNDD